MVSDLDLNNFLCPKKDVKSCTVYLGLTRIWALIEENLTLLHVNNKVAYQPVHLRSLTSAFVIDHLKSLVVKLALSKFQYLGSLYS